jgi:adenylate kinase family enzyme
VQRVCILGASGAGKTTLAARLAARLGVEHVELDALYHGPNWTARPPDEFRARVDAIVERDAWVIDGGYGAVLGDVVPRAADTIVWLDLPLLVTLARLTRRSAGSSCVQSCGTATARRYVGSSAAPTRFSLGRSNDTHVCAESFRHYFGRNRTRARRFTTCARSAKWTDSFPRRSWPTRSHRVGLHVYDV